ncbi:MAG: hypothetical protein AB1461_16905 [Thermodesulfobacteriota bacterium]
MISNFFEIEKKELNIPTLWDNNWDEIIGNADGVEKELIIVQARAASLLKKINDTGVSFARLAWLNLWTRNINLLDATFAAILSKSDFSLEIFTRIIFEYDMQVFAIFEPMLNSNMHRNDNSNIKIFDKNEFAKFESVKRLNAYAAWCLWSDKEYLESYLHKKTLDGIWDVEPTKELLDGFENEDQLRAYERIFGKLKIDLDEKQLKINRLKQQDSGQKNLNCINNLLNHNSELKEWHDKIKEIRGKNKNNNIYRPISFYELFNETEKSVAKRLSSLGMRFSYVTYSRGSLYMHGSTFTNFFYFGEDSITPKIVTHKSIIEKKASHIGSCCNNTFVILGILMDKLWPKKRM